MNALLGAVSQVGTAKIRCDDDFVDRLSHRYTTFILVVFAIVVSTKQYVGEPINCWCPAHFTDNHEDYTNKVCWVSNTYFLPFKTKVIPEAEEPRALIGYYQWVPMILLCQALVCYLPCMVWRFMNNKSGIDVNNIVESAMTMQHFDHAENRDRIIRFMTKHLDRYLGATREWRRGCFTECKQFISKRCCLICGKKYGNYLVVLYIMVKFFYLANLLGQLFMLNTFLGTDYHVYGAQILQKMWSNEDWESSPTFPRVTLCDFEIRQLGNIHRHTVQCVLPINLFNEKIYIFIWFWFLFVALATFLSLLTAVARTFFRIDQIRYIKHHLRAMDQLSKHDNDKKAVSKFVTQYLRQDGVLVLRLVSINSNQIVSAELISELWRNYKTSSPLIERNRRNDMV